MAPAMPSPQLRVTGRVAVTGACVAKMPAAVVAAAQDLEATVMELLAELGG